MAWIVPATFLVVARPEDGFLAEFDGLEAADAAAADGGASARPAAGTSNRAAVATTIAAMAARTNGGRRAATTTIIERSPWATKFSGRTRGGCGGC
jgi:hypothetical protein